MPTRPRIAVTMGDPAGVGPEVILRACVEPSVVAACVPIIFGDAAVMTACGEQLGLPVPQRVVRSCDEAANALNCDEPTILDLGLIEMRAFTPGTVSAATGRAAYGYIDAAIVAALARQVAAVTTAPISKEGLHAAGYKYPGHTEIFAERFGAARSCMMQYSEEITCAFVTTHVGYAEVPKFLTVERILDVIELAADALRRIRGLAPRIVVCGLNPHAGEHGLFGDREEERIIGPAIAEARARGHDVEGPLPPDTAFLPWKRRTTDVFICMYHDQGHIPVKALAFDSAVNTTLGPAILRTSVDHGTACDIAWTGKADPGSLFHALRLAARLAS